MKQHKQVAFIKSWMAPMQNENRTIEKAFSGIEIVLRGHFNPAIFHPLWFAKNQLLRKSEIDEVLEDTENKNILSHSDITLFSTVWMTLQVTSKRLSMSTTTIERFLELRDLAIGTFSLLTDTPVSAFGLNYSVHFALPEQVSGLKLMKYMFAYDAWEALLKKPTLQSISVEEEYDEERSIRVSLNVEPSNRLKGKGIFSNLNFHKELELEPGDGAEPFSVSLPSLWDEFYEKALSTEKKLEAMLCRSL